MLPHGQNGWESLLRAGNGTVELIERSLLEKAEEELRRLKTQEKPIRCVREKAESEKWEGWCAVLSSKAKRKQPTKRGVIFTRPAMHPVRVMGMQWSVGVLAGMSGVAQVAVTRGWTTKGTVATTWRKTGEEVLRITVRTGGTGCGMSLTAGMPQSTGFSQ